MNDRRAAVEEIRKVIAKYARTVDERNVSELAECFTGDAVLELDDGAVRTSGRDAIQELYVEQFRRPVLSPPARSTHLMGSSEIDIENGSATARAHTIALALLHTGDGLITRGLTYADEFHEVDGAWLIAHRRHRCEWHHGPVPPGVDRPGVDQ